MNMMKLSARGEEFKIAQVQGNLFVCAEENGGCCCGHTEKGRALVNKDLYGQLWEDRRLRNKVHLTFVGCLGPCPIGNNAMLQIHGRSIWFKDLNHDRFIPMVYDYIEAMAQAGQVLAPTGELADHVYERYLPAAQGEAVSFGAQAAHQMEQDLEGLDPVCMMTVDPATAQWQSEFNGQAYYFCSGGCKKAFDKDPSAYVQSGELQRAQTDELESPAAPVIAPSDAETEIVTLVAPDIDCDHCAKSIMRGLQKTPGIAEVSVNVPTKRVAVRFVAPASLDSIKAALVDIGYPPSQTMGGDSDKQENSMTKTFVVPAISCDHCVRSIKNEVCEIEGVKTVDADSGTKVVTVAWEQPATWDQIKAALTDIEYPPQELMQP